MDKQATP